ncbi:MAG TPA: class I SAM-dependent methyltransferase [Chromatiales bacterium]|nr:class I SAM-dependent methyltransferase [Chromatiales bacterium]
MNFTKYLNFLRAFIFKASSSKDSPPQPIRWTHELVEKFWGGFSQTRLVEYSFSRQAGRSLIIAIDHLLPKNGHILDYGAGDGDLMRLLCERGTAVSGFEPSDNRAQKLISKLKDYSGFKGIVGNTENTTFDLVLMAEVIEHVLDEDLDECLNRLEALVKPGGLIIVTTPNNEDLDLGMAYCPVSNVLFHRWQHVRSFTKESLVDLLSKYGFDEVVTHQIEFNDSLYVPFDQQWGKASDNSELPSYLQQMRTNQPTRIGGETNLLYIGKRRT